MPTEQEFRRARRKPRHPLELLEGLAYGWLTEPEAAAVQAHVESCQSCHALLVDAAAIREQLAVLALDEPRIDVLQQVLRRIESDD